MRWLILWCSSPSGKQWNKICKHPIGITSSGQATCSDPGNTGLRNSMRRSCLDFLRLPLPVKSMGLLSVNKAHLGCLGSLLKIWSITWQKENLERILVSEVDQWLIDIYTSNTNMYCFHWDQLGRETYLSIWHMASLLHPQNSSLKLTLLGNLAKHTSSRTWMARV